MLQKALGRARWADLALVVVVAGAIVRIWRWRLDRPLWMDEQNLSLNLRERGFAELVGALDYHQAAPLGWLWSVRLTLELFGSGERALRLVPLLFGIGTLVVAWWIGRRWLGLIGASVLVGLFAVAPALLRYSNEVKQYSSDVFWVLLLIGLAGVVVERPEVRRPLLGWWAVAALASWFSMAAVLAAPGLAVVMLAVLWRRSGRGAALRGALAGAGWLASFGLHYLLSLRHTVGDPYLVKYWEKWGFPPAEPWHAALIWLAGRPYVLARDPVQLAPEQTVLFWCAALVGLLLAGRRLPAHALLLSAPILSGFVLALAGIVPLSGRLALWLIPSLFVAVAVSLEAPWRAAALFWRDPERPTVVPAVAVALAGVVAIGLCGHAVRPHLRQALAPPGLNNGIDDRGAITWLVAHRRPSDIVLISSEAWATWRWYAGFVPPVPLAHFRQGTEGDCDPSALAALTRGRTRVLAYVREYPNAPNLAAKAFRARIGDVGTVTATHSFGAGNSLVYVVELRDGSRARPVAARHPPSAHACLRISVP
jgi:hypothetical protein